MNIDSRISLVNAKLKTAKVGVSIETRGDHLWLRATLPPKPHINKLKPYQQRISLGVRATVAGLQHAEQKARLIGAQLDLGKFDWSEWIETPIDTDSVKNWVERFEQDYWGRVKQTQASQTTWKTEYAQVFGKLPSSETLSLELLLDAIAQTQPDSRNRKRYCVTLHKLAEFAGLERREKIKELTGSYSAAAVNPRMLPGDAAIAQYRSSINSPAWQWLVGMLATYGLRGHEVFRLDLSDFPVVRVLEGKTGARFVYPLYPEWSKEWNLQELKLPNLDKSYSNAKLGTKISGWFYDRKTPFKAYDLRHCYARRCFEFGLAPDWAAGLMGHSVKVHLSTYRAWIDEATYRRVYETVINREGRPIAPLS